jgi:hypothetical protein
MRPRPNFLQIEIPLSFDMNYKSKRLRNSDFLIALGVILVAIIGSVLSIIFADGMMKLYQTLGILFVAFNVVRFMILKERYYKKQKEKLRLNENTFNSNLFWGIYEISPKFPFFARYQNGWKSIFVRLEKDIIIGKEDDNEYQHYEAIANALRQTHKREIEYFYIDYMDIVGEDKRIDNLFDMVDKSKNEDLKEVLTHIFNNVEVKMQGAYATYDVYAFFYKGREKVFWEELKKVMDYFMGANYTNYKVLDEEEISKLAETVLNLNNFSVKKAYENVFETSMQSSFIKPIWIEKNNERKNLNKTQEELEQEREIKEERKKMEKKVKKKRKRKGEDEIVDLFK